MFHENEDQVKTAGGVSSDGSSCRHTFASSARVKTPGSCVKHLRWLHIQLLLVLLAGQASCTNTTAAPTIVSSTTTNATSAVHYFIDVAVEVSGQNKNESDIISWLKEVFQTSLENCVSPTATPATAGPTSVIPSNETTLTTAATPLQSNNTATATANTTLQSYNTTAAEASTTIKSNDTTSAEASTTIKSDNTTLAEASTTIKSDNTTTATIDQFTTAASEQNSSTASSDSTGITSANITDTSTKETRKPNPGQGNNVRVVREIGVSLREISGIDTDRTASLFQGMEVSCAMKTAISNTNCSVMLRLRQSVPACCILRALCTASKTFPEIHIVGKKADRIYQLQTECNSTEYEEDSCVYSGQKGALCDNSPAAYWSRQSNSTYCGAGRKNNCSCSAYCSAEDAYYTFGISIQDPNMNLSYVSSLISKLKQSPNCSSSAEVPCPLSIVASEYKDANVLCGGTTTNLGGCSVILGFGREVPICAVFAAVRNLFQPEKQINFNGRVTQAAICGNAGVGGNPLESQFTWQAVNLKPADFCLTMEDSLTNILNCPEGKNAVVLLGNQCVQPPFTTPSPNMTTTQPNATTSSVNVTSTPLNTTAEPLNTTTSMNTTSTINTTSTTTTSINTTSTINTTSINTTINTTSSSTTSSTTTTTIAANVTMSPTLSTATTSNESGDVTPSTTHSSTESPTTTLSDEGQANALLELTRDVSQLNSSQVNQLVSQLESLLSGPTVSLALGNTSVHIVSNLLGASPETLSESSNRIIGIVDTVALKLVLADTAETLLSPAVALSVKPADGTNFQETFFSISDPSNVQVRGDPRLRRSVRTDSSIPQGSIRLPPSLTQDLTTEQQQQVSRVQFNFYQKSTVFQDRSMGERRLNSGILGASVANLSITGLQDDVVIFLRNMEPVPANYVATCAYWDFTLNNRSGGWNADGCHVQNSTDNETICGCNHLTSFAILLDLSREPLTSRVQATILTFITYIGCGISAIFLSVTLLTYLSFGKLRKDIPSKILIQLCLALLLLNLVFLVDAWLALYPDALGLCISTAWFLHYFLLASFTWMGLEAVHMYLALVKVFNSYISRYMLKFSLVGWGVPMIVVIIVIAIDKNNYGLVTYGRFTDGTSDDFCWLKNDVAFYVAVVAYFCVIFLFNFTMFIVVLIQLCRIKRQNPHNALHRTTLQDARSVAGLTILLGLTWGFAFFAWGPVNLAFMYLFAIFNSLQGLFIFVFHCAVKENVRKQWRTYLCCGKMRLAENSEWSRTATQKTMKKSLMTKLPLHSSTSSNSNSSSSFFVSDSSEHTNGISSPFEDRTITADEDPGGDVVLNEINRQYRNQQAH